MKVPFTWLKEFLPTTHSLHKIDSTLTLAGLEVDGINGTFFNFKGVITARVIEVSKHPESDRLQIAKVDTGKEILQIVCGASNCRKNLVTALAQIGSELNHPKNGKITIQKTQIRKIDSYGMLCSKDELGLEETSEGILELPESTKLGVLLEELLFNPVFEISLTPNLGHCFSIIGVARELSYHDEAPLKSLRASDHVKFQSGKKFNIKIETPHCAEYHLAAVKNIKIAPSPDWLQERLRLSGIKPINNVVDALNYVMHETGQPMHAYDLDQIRSEEIIVKEAQRTTPFLALDAVLREIPKETLMIYNGDQPAAIAGIIGGQSTMISDSSKNILIEAAHFSSKKIRQGMKNIGMRTEAGAHFEKGIDRAIVLIALSRAVELIQKISQSHEPVDLYSDIQFTLEPKIISLRPNRVNKLIGTQLSLNEIISILEKIGCLVLEKHEHQLKLQIPTYRNDLNEEIDLVEEVVRIFGFNNIEKSSGFYRNGTVGDSPLFTFECEIREKLLSLGLQEMVSCNLISPKEALIGLPKDLKESQLISMLHAKSLDQSILRPSLIPSFLKIVKHNLNFNSKNISGFEIGRVHFYDQGNMQEKFAVGVLLCGKAQINHFSDKGVSYTFYDLKGFIETLLDSFGIDYNFILSRISAFHPGQQAEIVSNGEIIGILGQLHPTESKKMDVEIPVFFAQLDLIELLKNSTKVKKMSLLAEFPSSSRDITLTLNKVISYEKILTAIHSVNLSILKEVECLDLFTSQSLGPHHHNVTLRLIYRSDEKTLDFETVEKGHHAIVQALSPLISSI